uniref:hypothetical protein n=1 Tax=Salmonella enterica TaxID=28901 RepID=UPI003FD7F57E
IKYRAFTAAWLSDVPAIALYRPQVAYLALTKTSSVKAGEVGDVADRFNNVVNWTAETDWLDNTR